MPNNYKVNVFYIYVSNSPAVTSYRLPMVTIGLFLTVFAVLRLVTDRQTDGIISYHIFFAQIKYRKSNIPT